MLIDPQKDDLVICDTMRGIFVVTEVYPEECMIKATCLTLTYKGYDQLQYEGTWAYNSFQPLTPDLFLKHLDKGKTVFHDNQGVLVKRP